MAATWSALPPDLLRLIAGNLDSVFDRASFCGVCSSWRSSSLDADAAVPPAPLLLLMTDHRDSSESPVFLDISDHRVRALGIPECAGGRDVLTTSHGWLVVSGGVSDVDRSEIFLIHPLTRERIDLPPYPDHDRDHRRVLKAVLSSGPSRRRRAIAAGEHDVFVGIMTPTRFAYCRVGVDVEWSTVPLDRRPPAVVGFAYRRRAFYFLHREGTVDKYIVGDEHAMSSRTILPSTPGFFSIWLAESPPGDHYKKAIHGRNTDGKIQVDHDLDEEDILVIAFFREEWRYEVFRLEETPERWCKVDEASSGLISTRHVLRRRRKLSVHPERRRWRRRR